MTKAEALHNVITIPSRLKLGGLSLLSLAKESGYYDPKFGITVEDIVAMLQSNPEIIDQWLQWSDDKRTSSGWFFQNNAHGKYVVALSPYTGEIPQQIFTDKYLACAIFIWNDLERMRPRITLQRF